MERTLPRPLAIPWLHVIAWTVLVVMGMLVWRIGSGHDAEAYWSARGYEALANEHHAFLYSPVVLYALAPFQALPWTVFHALFTAAQLAALVWLVGPVLAVVVLVPGAYSPAFTDLWYGNVSILTAAVAMAGFRHPGWWAVLPFGKVLPGVVLLWSLVRGQWKPVAVVVMIALVAFAVRPEDWFAWFAVLQGSSEAGVGTMTAFLIPRAIIAAMLVIVGAWRGWRWVVPPAVLLAQPVLWYGSFVILLGWVWLLRERHTPGNVRALFQIRR